MNDIRCPGDYCKSKQDCKKAIYPAKGEAVTWAALWTYLDDERNSCCMFEKLELESSHLISE